MSSESEYTLPPDIKRMIEEGNAARATGGPEVLEEMHFERSDDKSHASAALPPREATLGAAAVGQTGTAPVREPLEGNPNISRVRGLPGSAHVQAGMQAADIEAQHAINVEGAAAARRLLAEVGSADQAVVEPQTPPDQS